MLVIEKPTPDELVHLEELERAGLAIVERKQPFAEVGPVEGADGQYWAKYERHGEPYANVYFIPKGVAHAT